MHSYEEIRDVVVDILLNREPVDYSPDQWEHLKLGVAQVLARRDNRQIQAFPLQRLSGEEAELVRDVFWDLFRQGYITIGLNDHNAEWPFFRLSHFGKTTLAQGDPYRFTDTSSYLRVVRSHVPDLDDLTSVYLDQAIRSFYAGCMLAACVMLGVATENRFLRLVQAVQASPSLTTTFRPVDEERTILQKITKFWNLLRPTVPRLPPEVREDLETHFMTILSVIRTFRNEAGHPSGREVSREQTYVLLQMFAPYARKLALLGEHLRQT
jgi:hypothetical protein